MRGRTPAPRFPRASAWTFTALLPLLTGCAVFGYPAPQPLVAPPAPVAEASVDDAALIVRPAAAPISTSAPTPRAAAAPRQYEVRGETYTVMADAGEYAEVGVASWYGNELAGRRTASGEVFNPQGLTAAHRTLPMSTWVEVKNLQNGRSVVVRVNDRGPFAATHERIIDVSLGAARVLGLVGTGTARVEVRVVPPPTAPRS